MASLLSVGPFDFTLLFYKRSLAGTKDDRRKYPYRSFNVGNRRRWLDEQGGVKIYRDDFLVRPYGETRGKAHDWLGLGARVAQNPLQASRKGWRVNPQQLAGTVAKVAHSVPMTANGALHTCGRIVSRRK